VRKHDRYAPISGQKKVIKMPTPSKTIVSQAEPNNYWRSLYRAGGLAALITAVLIPLQIVVFVAWPPLGGPVKLPRT
jgi:hypothetical protein